VIGGRVPIFGPPAYAHIEGGGLGGIYVPQGGVIGVAAPVALPVFKF
jgi:hypothetical protein